MSEETFLVLWLTPSGKNEVFLAKGSLESIAEEAHNIELLQKESWDIYIYALKPAPNASEAQIPFPGMLLHYEMKVPFRDDAWQLLWRLTHVVQSGKDSPEGKLAKFNQFKEELDREIKGLRVKHELPPGARLSKASVEFEEDPDPAESHQ